jgi:NAD-dependent SIR2 family protein deacetylase
MMTSYEEVLIKERDEARSLAEEACNKYNELLKQRRVTCIFCGHQYEDDTSESQDKRLINHIIKCDKHPIKTLGKSLCDLIDMPFPPTEKSLKEMRIGITAIAEDISNNNVKNILSALDALKIFVCDNN